MRFQLAGLGRIKHLHVGDAVGARSGSDMQQGPRLRCIDGDDELAAAAMIDATVGAVAIQLVATGDAKPTTPAPITIASTDSGTLAATC